MCENKDCTCENKVTTKKLNYSALTKKILYSIEKNFEK